MESDHLTEDLRPLKMIIEVTPEMMETLEGKPPREIARQLASVFRANAEWMFVERQKRGCSGGKIMLEMVWRPDEEKKGDSDSDSTAGDHGG